MDVRLSLAFPLFLQPRLVYEIRAAFSSDLRSPSLLPLLPGSSKFYTPFPDCL